LAEHVSTEKGRLDIGARVLNDMYRQASRPEEKKRIEGKMMELAARQELVELNEQFVSFVATSRASALPKKKQFQMFLRASGHKSRDLMNRPLEIDVYGKIAPATRD